MAILLIPLIIVTATLFFKRNKSPQYKTLFIITAIFTLILVAITLWLAFGLQGIKD